jgi:NTP pyrophosphatase (non-canonical NTP hydrolase)
MASWPKSSATSCCKPSSTPRWLPRQNLFRIDDALDAINRQADPAPSARLRRPIGGDRRRRQAHLGPGEGRREEKGQGREQDGLLAPVPRALPALVEAQQISSRAAGAGFDWENPEQVLGKLHEELAEFAEARRRNASHDEIENEMGDLLFVLVNLARFVKVDPEQALRRTNAKFRKRFSYIERKLAERGRKLEDSNIGEMEALWQEAKR